MHHRNIPRPSIYNRPNYHHDDYASGEVIYITNPGTGHVEARQTVDRRRYINTTPSKTDPSQER